MTDSEKTIIYTAAICLAALCVAVLLGGCVTTVQPDGSQVTRIDTDQVILATELLLTIYERIEAGTQPDDGQQASRLDTILALVDSLAERGITIDGILDRFPRAESKLENE